MTAISNIISGQGGAGRILSRILGSNQQAVHSGVSKASGLDSGKAAQLVALIALFVLSAISNKKQEDGLQPTQVARTLQQAQQTAHAEAQRQSPQWGGILGS